MNNAIEKIFLLANALDDWGFVKSADTVQNKIKNAQTISIFEMANINSEKYVGSESDNEALRAAITKKHRIQNKISRNYFYPNFYEAYVKEFGIWDKIREIRKNKLNKKFELYPKKNDANPTNPNLNATTSTDEYPISGDAKPPRKKTPEQIAHEQNYESNRIRDMFKPKPPSSLEKNQISKFLDDTFSENLENIFNVIKNVVKIQKTQYDRGNMSPLIPKETKTIIINNLSELKHIQKQIYLSFFKTDNLKYQEYDKLIYSLYSFLKEHEFLKQDPDISKYFDYMYFVMRNYIKNNEANLK